MEAELPLKALEAELPLKALETELPPKVLEAELPPKVLETEQAEQAELKLKALYREGKITKKDYTNLYNICRNYTKRYNYEKKIIKEISVIIAKHYQEFLHIDEVKQLELLYLKLLELME
jgi:hypothetical protein